MIKKVVRGDSNEPQITIQKCSFLFLVEAGREKDGYSSNEDNLFLFWPISG